MRPARSQVELETQEGLVRDNYLAGQYGGITMSQWKVIAGLTGVQTAAPVAMLGFVPVTGFVDIDVTKSVREGVPTQVVRLANSWVTDRGLSRISDPGSTFVYVTSSPVVWPSLVPAKGSQPGFDTVEYRYQGHAITADDSKCPDAQTLPSPAVLQPDGSFEVVCTEANGTLDDGTVTSVDRGSAANRSTILVAQRNANGTFTYAKQPGAQPVTAARLTIPVYWTLSLMMAAIDSDAEDRLVGLDHALAAGSALSDSQLPVSAQLKDGGPGQQHSLIVGVPILLSASSGLDEQLSTRSASVTGAVPSLTGLSPRQIVSELDGMPVRWNTTALTTAQSMYASTVTAADGLDPDYRINDPYQLAGGGIPLNPRIKAGQVTFRESSGSVLNVRERGPSADSSLWNLSNYATNTPIPAYAFDDGFRDLSQSGNVANVSNVVTGDPVGVFDPAKIDQFSSLSAVAMETFASPTDSGASADSARLLDGRSLGANSNPGSYVEAPPELLTTMAAVPYILDKSDPQYKAPISEIQVRVAGVTGVDAESEARLAAVAEEIEKSTGLQVDIVAGSSPTPVKVALPAGAYGRPSLLLQEQWSRKGVGVALVENIDRKSVLLFGLVLVICIVFVGNAAAATVRTRRSELAILGCVGWSGVRLAALVLGEVLAVALLAGSVGVVLAFPLAQIAGVHIGVTHALLAVPVALGVAGVAATPSALRAGRAHPGSALRPPALPVARMTRVGTIRSMAWRWAARTPGRSCAAVGALALGVTAMGLLVGIDTTFHATAADSLLGDAVGVRVRAADGYAAVVAFALSIAAAADVIYLGVKERERELAMLRATGWDGKEVGKLVLWESVLIAALAALIGGALSVLCTLALLHTLPGMVYVTLFALLLIAMLLTLSASLVPAWLSTRAPIAALLAEE